MGKNIVALLVTAIAAAAAGYYVGGGAMCSYDKGVVLVARQDIVPGTVLTEDMLETRDMPRLYMQQDSFEVRDMTDLKLAVGHTALVSIPKGNQVGRSSLKAPAGAVPAAPENPAQAHYLEGIKYLQNSNYAKSAAEFEAALKLDPRHAEAKAGLERVKKITAGGK